MGYQKYCKHQLHRSASITIIYQTIKFVCLYNLQVRFFNENIFLQFQTSTIALFLSKFVFIGRIEQKPFLISTPKRWMALAKKTLARKKTFFLFNMRLRNTSWECSCACVCSCTCALERVCVCACMSVRVCVCLKIITIQSYPPLWRPRTTTIHKTKIIVEVFILKDPNDILFDTRIRLTTFLYSLIWKTMTDLKVLDDCTSVSKLISAKLSQNSKT